MSMRRTGYILSAEDSANDQALMQMVLAESEADCDLVFVDDGVQVLDFLYRRGQFANRQRANPLAILLDIKMPRLTGIEVLRRLKQDPDFRTIPIIMFTSSGERPDVESCYNLGVNAYVVKAMDFDQFSESLKVLRHFWTQINQPPTVAG
ncbi:MAG TPA: response regulator [Candidatus Binataceae bacterium]|nr:response regulator [Candidatus Binataceae bacterium]